MNFQSKPKWSPSVRNAKMHGAAPKIYHLLMKLIMISTENFQEKKNPFLIHVFWIPFPKY